MPVSQAQIDATRRQQAEAMGGVKNSPQMVRQQQVADKVRQDPNIQGWGGYADDGSYHRRTREEDDPANSWLGKGVQGFARMIGQGHNTRSHSPLWDEKMYEGGKTPTDVVNLYEQKLADLYQERRYQRYQAEQNPDATADWQRQIKEERRLEDAVFVGKRETRQALTEAGIPEKEINRLLGYPSKSEGGGYLTGDIEDYHRSMDLEHEQDVPYGTYTFGGK